MNNKLILNLSKVYSAVERLSDELYRVWQSGKVGIFSASNYLIIVPVKYNDVIPTEDGTTFEVREGAQWRILSSENVHPRRVR